MELHSQIIHLRIQLHYWFWCFSDVKNPEKQQILLYPVLKQLDVRLTVVKLFHLSFTIPAQRDAMFIYFFFFLKNVILF